MDAELLAEVYINMTRGQEALIMESVEASVAGQASAKVELSGFQLPVLAANEQELAAHEDVLGQLDKASGGKTVWRNAAASAAA